MGLLDNEPTPRYTPKEFRGKKYTKQTALSQQARDEELNNLGRKKEVDDFSDSNFLDT